MSASFVKVVCSTQHWSAQVDAGRRFTQADGQWAFWTYSMRLGWANGAQEDIYVPESSGGNDDNEVSFCFALLFPFRAVVAYYLCHALSSCPAAVPSPSYLCYLVRCNYVDYRRGVRAGGGVPCSVSL